MRLINLNSKIKKKKKIQWSIYNIKKSSLINNLLNSLNRNKRLINVW